LLGVGLGNFRAAYGDLLVPDLPLLAYTLGVPEGAHNLFLNLAVEVGLVGAGAFAWLLAVAFLRAWQVKRFADQQVRVWGTGLAAGLVAILVHTLVDVVIYQGFVAILLFAYLGIMDALRRFASGQVGYEHTPPTIPSSTTSRDQRGTPSATYMEFDRPQSEPVRYPFVRHPEN
jgi:O-antigen ligase